MHHSLILKYTSRESRKNSQHLIHLSNTRICRKATINKTKFKLSQLLPLEKALSFQDITDVWDRLSFQVWIRNLWLKSSVEGNHVNNTPVAQACLKKLSMALSLSFCSLYFAKFIDFNIPSADLSAHSGEYFPFKNRWYGNFWNIASVKPKVYINVNLSWTSERMCKLILKNTLRTYIYKKAFTSGFISINLIW